MATANQKPTITHTDLENPLDPFQWLNRTRTAHGLPLVNDDERTIANRRREVYEKCEFNRRCVRVFALLLKARDAVEELADMDEVASITEAWLRAGLPPLADRDIDAEAEHDLGEAEVITRGAAGCAWTMEQFITILDGIIPGGGRRRRGN